MFMNKKCRSSRAVCRLGTARCAPRAGHWLAVAIGVLGLLLQGGQANAFNGDAVARNPVSAPLRIPDGARRFEPASVLARPNLRCSLQSANNKNGAMVIHLVTDRDGYARFHAVRATSADAVQKLNLDCVDAAGKPSFYSVDLTAEETFKPRPLDLAQEPGTDRPALHGDPMSYSQSQLIAAGYGLRPDPSTSPAAYARWLASASRPGRLLQTKRPSTHAPSAISAGVTSVTEPYWVGSVLTGAPSYESIEAIFNVPTAIAGGDQTTATAVSIWNGLGGFNTGSGLIQGGVTLQTTPSAAYYGVFREYCCGDPYSNGYAGAFTPNPGDQIYSIQWYCDANGNMDINGGFGCSYLHDMTSGAILSCTLAAGYPPPPCWSVPALPLCSVNPNAANCMTLGVDAEFIIEDQSPQVSSTSTAFTEFTPTVTMAGSAYSSATGSSSQTISTDSAVELLTDFTDTTTRINVSLGSSDETYFSIQGMTNSIWKYTGSPCTPSGCNGWTALDDNPATSALAASGANLYQLHTGGSIWKFTGAACGGSFCAGWAKYDDNPATVAIAADGGHLYQLHGSGEIWKSTGAPCTSSGCAGWTKLDDNKSAATAIVAAGGHLYQLRNTGAIWEYIGPACRGSACAGWVQLDSNPLTVRIVADGSNLYQLHSSGQVWKFTGTVCSGTYCPGWTRIDSNPATVAITSGGGHVYELHNDGGIWKWKGAACQANCWVQLDNNPITTAILADGHNLYEVHNTGSVWQSTGAACNGASCPGWFRIDANSMTSTIAAGGGQVYELHGN